MMSNDRPATRLATRLSFLIAGFGIACWAPLVPFTKQRLAVDNEMLGLLLLCLGIGSLIAMQITGTLCMRFGSGPAIVAGGLGVTLLLPLLSIVARPAALAVTLLSFGVSLGSLDVAMNIHAVEVERAADRPLMSGFHALFSIGGFAGASLITVLLSSRLGPLASTIICAVPMLVAVLLAWPRLLTVTHGGKGPLFAMPSGIVLLICCLAAATFLTEGAILDWSALLLATTGLVGATKGGFGYMLFAIAMAAGRLTGDAVISRIGERRALFWGGMVAVAGFAVLLEAPVAFLAMAGFLLIGLGAANIVPVLFRKAGSQQVMPPALAVSALTTIGYAGVLAGPATIGFVSQAVGLHDAFFMLAALLCFVPLTARFVANEPGGRQARAGSGISDCLDGHV